MFCNNPSRVIDELRGLRWKQFLLQLGRPRDVLKARKKLGFHPRSKMSKQIRRANARELFAQARRLQIEFRQLRPLAAAFIMRAYAPRGFKRRQPRANLAAQHSPGRGDEFHRALQNRER